MSEKLKFFPSGLIKDDTDLTQIVFWGHDAGEFSEEEIAEIVEGLEKQEKEQSKEGK